MHFRSTFLLLLVSGCGAHLAEDYSHDIAPIPEDRWCESGLSNRAIAERRNASVRTVANQLAGTYRKLGVGSRFELMARLQPPDEGSDA